MAPLVPLKSQRESQQLALKVGDKRIINFCLFLFFNRFPLFRSVSIVEGFDFVEKRAASTCSLVRGRIKAPDRWKISLDQY